MCSSDLLAIIVKEISLTIFLWRRGHINSRGHISTRQGICGHISTFLISQMVPSSVPPRPACKVTYGVRLQGHIWSHIVPSYGRSRMTVCIHLPYVAICDHNQPEVGEPV